MKRKFNESCVARIRSMRRLRRFKFYD